MLKALTILTLLAGSPVLTGGPAVAMVLAQLPAAPSPSSSITAALVPIVLAALAVGGVGTTLVDRWFKRRETADTAKQSEADRMWKQIIDLSAKQGELTAKVEQLLRDVASKDIIILQKEAEITRRDVQIDSLKREIATLTSTRPGGTSGTSA